MAFKDEWVDKKNKTSTAPGDKLKAEDINLLASGIKEALDRVPDVDIDLSDYVTKAEFENTVGNIGTALYDIIAIQNSYINDVMAANEGGDAQ